MRIVSSQRAGMGKSLYIKRRSEALKAVTTNDLHGEVQEMCDPDVDEFMAQESETTSDDSYEVIVPIHGPVVTADTVLGALKKHIGMSRPIIFHLDIAPNVSACTWYLCSQQPLLSRCYGRWTLSCSVCWCCKDYVIVRVMCGGVILPICT